MGKAILHLNTNFIGWFAISRSRDLKINQDIMGVLNNKPYLLSRLGDGCLLFNGRKEIIIEQNQFIFVWHHPNNLPPIWYPPILAEQGWRYFRHHQFSIRSHPQEIYENCVDLAHFSPVHRYRILTVYPPLFADHSMLVKYQIQRRHLNFFSRKKLKINFAVQLYGIGCAHTHITVPALGLAVRMFTLTTPVQKGWVDIRLAVAIKVNTSFIGEKIFLPIIHKMIQQNIVNDFSQDINIWQNKCYHEAPLLVKGDGQIMKFRRWCQQFYLKGS